MLIDSHCHLDQEHFDADRGEVLARAATAGVERIVIPAIDLENLDKVLALADSDERLFAAVGIHPNSTANWRDEDIDVLRQTAGHARVVAIGEIGLDNYWHDATPAQQERALWAQLKLAADVGKPVIIHSREANDQVATMLREWVASAHFRSSPLARREFCGVLHAFSGDLALAQQAYDWGFVLSLGGPVTYKSAHALHALVPHLRLDRLMLETDAPYLTPHPLRGKRNEPAYVAMVAEQIARLRGTTVEEVATVTSQVAERFFGWRAIETPEVDSRMNDPWALAVVADRAVNGTPNVE